MRISHSHGAEIGFGRAALRRAPEAMNVRFRPIADGHRRKAIGQQRTLPKDRTPDKSGNELGYVEPRNSGE